MNRLTVYSANSEILQILIQTMNGRMYDPAIGRVLSPDKFVQSPGYTQSYNRYSYCFNNPLRYTDPGGWYVMLSNGHKVGMDFNDWGVSSSANLYMPGSGGSYQYNESTGDYTLNGEVVSYWQVHNNYIAPSSTEIYNSNNVNDNSNNSTNNKPNSIYAVNIQYTGTLDNPYSNLRGFRMSDGSFVSINSGYASNISATLSHGGADVEWISQYDPRVPDYGRDACKRACYIMNPNALRGMGNGYYVGKEKGKSFITTNQTSKGYQYLNQQLSLNRSVIVGVGRNLAGYWGMNLNGDFTTDHFVIVDHLESDGYHFLDPGTRYPAIGTSANNVFRLGANGLYSGSSYGAPMTITWIGFNH